LDDAAIEDIKRGMGNGWCKIDFRDYFLDKFPPESATPGQSPAPGQTIAPGQVPAPLQLWGVTHEEYQEALRRSRAFLSSYRELFLDYERFNSHL
jgi:hypothetical protein